jgi:SAM-dependent methyltransferase
MQMAWGYAPPLMLEAAVRNGVFDALEGGPRTVSQVAAATGAAERGLRALMDGLVGLELLGKEGDRYRLTEESAAFLVSGKPGFRGGFFKHVSTQLLPRWLDLSEIVRTGRSGMNVNRQEQGAEFFREFVEDLFPMGYGAAKTLAAELRLAEAAAPVNVLDIAAGSGVWGIGLAEASRHVRVTVVDWPEVVPVTRRVAGRHGVEERFRYLEGDLLEVDYGTGYQVATLGHILHSEGRERSRRLLRKVADALEPGGTIVIAEWIPNEERTGPPHALIFGVNMLVATDAGDVFTFGEMSEWLLEAGFTDPRLLEAPSPSPLVLATRS